MIRLASGTSSIPWVICVIMRMRFQECDRRSRHEILFWHSSIHCLSKMAAYPTKKKKKFYVDCYRFGEVFYWEESKGDLGKYYQKNENKNKTWKVKRC